jgi:hypothetical protein
MRLSKCRRSRFSRRDIHATIPTAHGTGSITVGTLSYYGARHVKQHRHFFVGFPRHGIFSNSCRGRAGTYLSAPEYKRFFTPDSVYSYRRDPARSCAKKSGGSSSAGGRRKVFIAVTGTVCTTFTPAFGLFVQRYFWLLLLLWMHTGWWTVVAYRVVKFEYVFIFIPGGGGIIPGDGGMAPFPNLVPYAVGLTNHTGRTFIPGGGGGGWRSSSHTHTRWSSQPGLVVSMPGGGPIPGGALFLVEAHRSWRRPPYREVSIWIRHKCVPLL